MRFTPFCYSCAAAEWVAERVFSTSIWAFLASILFIEWIIKCFIRCGIDHATESRMVGVLRGTLHHCNWLVWFCMCGPFEVFRFHENEPEIKFQTPLKRNIGNSVVWAEACGTRCRGSTQIQATYVRLSRIYHFITCLICLPVERTLCSTISQTTAPTWMPCSLLSLNARINSRHAVHVPRNRVHF